MTEIQALNNGKEECRLLPDTTFRKQYQTDGFCAGGANIRKRAENEAAPCKSDQKVSDSENPGALAGATGAKENKEAAQLHEAYTGSLAARHPIIATHWGAFLSPGEKSACAGHGDRHA